MQQLLLTRMLAALHEPAAHDGGARPRVSPLDGDGPARCWGVYRIRTRIRTSQDQHQDECQHQDQDQKQALQQGTISRKSIHIILQSVQDARQRGKPPRHEPGALTGCARCYRPAGASGVVQAARFFKSTSIPGSRLQTVLLLYWVVYCTVLYCAALSWLSCAFGDRSQTTVLQ